MAEPKATQAKTNPQTPAEPKATQADAGAAKGGQVSLALANLVSGGLSLKEARKRLGE